MRSAALRFLVVKKKSDASATSATSATQVAEVAEERRLFFKNQDFKAAYKPFTPV